MKNNTIKIIVSVIIILGSLTYFKLVHGETITHSFSKVDITAIEAAERVNFNGTIDSAYTIGSVLIIVSDGNIHAYGKSKKSRYEDRGYIDRSSFGIDDDDTISSIENKNQMPKALVGLVPIKFYEQCESDEALGNLDECLYEIKIDNGYYSAAIDSLDKIIQGRIWEKVAAREIGIDLKEVKDKMCSAYKLMVSDLTEDEKEKYKSTMNVCKSQLMSRGIEEKDCPEVFE